jgi:hypothetical protein
VAVLVALGVALRDGDAVVLCVRPAVGDRVGNRVGCGVRVGVPVDDAGGL